MREPVGPPADLSRASAAGFREPPPSRDVRDKDYEGGRRPARNEPLTRERDAEFGYRNTSTAAPRESRGPPRQDGDQGWSRRALPQDPRTQNVGAFSHFSRMSTDLAIHVVERICNRQAAAGTLLLLDELARLCLSAVSLALSQSAGDEARLHRLET